MFDPRSPLDGARRAASERYRYDFVRQFMSSIFLNLKLPVAIISTQPTFGIQRIKETTMVDEDLHIR